MKSLCISQPVIGEILKVDDEDVLRLDSLLNEPVAIQRLERGLTRATHAGDDPNHVVGEWTREYAEVCLPRKERFRERGMCHI